jgi:hypothetical protein
MPQKPVVPAAQRVVALVMERLSLNSPAELAKALEMPPYSSGAINQVRRWIRGDHGPNFDYTMTMLSKAGLLSEEADRAWKGLPALDAAGAARAAREEAEAAERLGREELGENDRRASGNDR